ncbi:hypothetical protein OIU85_017784 [Salix viminalis]|uniref:Uncharacterized protein n=1 Tax=Salix viminalis TaxID=40686 RepID=A0A9Q0V8W5_SALVM|nr:hypothetical protein OIU85_017784 [Salix viminalis]
MGDIEASAGSGRVAFAALSRYVAAGIRTRWLTWTVTSWIIIIGAGCSELWLLVHGIRRPGCSHKRISPNKDQEHKEDGLCPRKERSLALVAHHGIDTSAIN